MCHVRMLHLSHLIIITMTTTVIMITTMANIAPTTPPIIEDSAERKIK